jgi:hypothetical protein
MRIINLFRIITSRYGGQRSYSHVQILLHVQYLVQLIARSVINCNLSFMSQLHVLKSTRNKMSEKWLFSIDFAILWIKYCIVHPYTEYGLRWILLYIYDATRIPKSNTLLIHTSTDYVIIVLGLLFFLESCSYCTIGYWQEKQSHPEEEQLFASACYCRQNMQNDMTSKLCTP